jgi:hypothetical protein
LCWIGAASGRRKSKEPPLLVPIDSWRPLRAVCVRLVIGNGAAKAIDDGLASLIARAIATRNMFLAGRDDSIDAMASRLGVRRDYVAVLVRLSYLSPEIVGAILVGQQPVELTPTMGKVDGRQSLAEKPCDQIIDLAA